MQPGEPSIETPDEAWWADRDCFWQQVAGRLGELLGVEPAEVVNSVSARHRLGGLHENLRAVIERCSKEKKSIIERFASPSPETFAALWDGHSMAVAAHWPSLDLKAEDHVLQVFGELVILRCRLLELGIAESLSCKLSTYSWQRETRSLASDFEELAQLITEHDRVVLGARLSIFEGEHCLAQGGFCLPAMDLDELESLWRRRPRSTILGPWAEVVDVEPWRDRHILMMPIASNAAGRGAVFIEVNREDPDSQMVVWALARMTSQIADGVLRAVNDQTTRRLKALQDLAQTELTHPHLDSGTLTSKLRDIFQADVTTLFLEEHGELRLAASTDESLQSRGPVVYAPGRGLTGWVFEKGRPLRLLNTEDPEEVKRVTGLDRPGPLHSERADDDVETLRYLAVPVTSGQKRRGVLRMSRLRHRSHFTIQDEKALAFFASMHGIALARSWDRFITHCIEDSHLVAIVVSRRLLLANGTKVPTVVWANRGAAETLGYENRRDLYGKDASTIYAPGEYSQIARKLRSTLSESNGEGNRELHVLTRVRTADGSFRRAEISFHLVADAKVQPPTYYTIGIARDTTESALDKQQHARLMSMLDDMSIAYFRADITGRTLESSAAEQRITGYRQDELAGFDRNRLYPHTERRENLIRRAREYGGKMVNVRQLLRRKDGEEFWASGALRVLKDSEEQEVGVEGLYRDVTNRLQLQSFIDAPTDRVLLDDELFEELKQNAEFQLDYQTSLGHQLLTPLVSLVENLRNFEEYLPPDSRASERMPYILGQARVCARLVRNLSFMDKILRGESFKKQRISLAKLAIETKLDFMHLLREKKMRLDIDDKSLDRFLVIDGHREMFRQVIVNLVDNAIKYSSKGSRILIRGVHYPEGRTFEITNRGLPLPEDRGALFKRGYRSSKAKMLVPHGTGLGLWLVGRIAEAHGAEVEYREIFEMGEPRNLFRLVFPDTKHRKLLRSRR